MSAAPALRIAGLTPLTTIDFPGRIAAVVWLRGCALRCGYCHNADLQNPAASPKDRPWTSVLDFFKRRKGLLEGAVFSGGEPLLQGALPDAVAALRDMGFRVALHTAGPSPERLSRLLPLLDWVGFDVKAPFDAYGPITGFPKSGEKARESLHLLKRSGVPFEIRTTIDPGLMDLHLLDCMATQLRDLGIRKWTLQEATGTSLPPGLEAKFSGIFEKVNIRREPSSRPDKPFLRSESGRYHLSGVKAA